MENEPEKVPNLNTVIWRFYVHRRKKLVDKGQRKFGSPFNLGDFPLETIKLPRMMVRFMKGAPHDIRKIFFNFYQGMVRSYHGTMPDVMFVKHVFHFSIVEKPINNAFVVDYCHTFP